MKTLNVTFSATEIRELKKEKAKLARKMHKRLNWHDTIMYWSVYNDY